MQPGSLEDPTLGWQAPGLEEGTGEKGQEDSQRTLEIHCSREGECRDAPRPRLQLRLSVPTTSDRHRCSPNNPRSVTRSARRSHDSPNLRCAGSGSKEPRLWALFPPPPRERPGS